MDNCRRWVERKGENVHSIVDDLPEPHPLQERLDRMDDKLDEILEFLKALKAGGWFGPIEPGGVYLLRPVTKS